MFRLSLLYLIAALSISACSTPQKYSDTITTTQTSESVSPLMTLQDIEIPVDENGVKQCGAFLSSMELAEQKVGFPRPNGN